MYSLTTYNDWGTGALSHARAGRARGYYVTPTILDWFNVIQLTATTISAAKVTSTWPPLIMRRKAATSSQAGAACKENAVAGECAVLPSPLY